ncbi:MAG: metallophosphoesterase [Acidimicrobiales bacterium]
MDLSTILLVSAVLSGLAGGVGARFRSWGTSFRDLGVGLMLGATITLLTAVVLALVAGLGRAGLVHLLYLDLVVGVPIAVALIALPVLLHVDRRRSPVAWAMILFALVVVAGGLWATHVEPNRLEVHRESLGASGADDPLVVGVLADLQSGNVGRHERDAVEELLAAEPHVIVIAGDFYEFPDDGTNDAIPEFVGLLRDMTEAVSLVVMVEGDHEDPDVLSDMAEATGAILLQDQVLDARVAGQALTIAGLRNPITDENRLAEEVRSDLSARSEDELVLLLSHRPDPVLLLDDLAVDLMIAGHTHGGQVSLPGIGPLVLFSEVPRVVAAGGLHLVDGHPIYVSTGVGMARNQAPQVRFRVPPSVAILTIVPN